MKNSHVYLRFLVLKTLFVMVFIIAPAWAELTPQQFGQAFTTALTEERSAKDTPVDGRKPADGIQASARI